MLGRSHAGLDAGNEGSRTSTAVKLWPIQGKEALRMLQWVTLGNSITRSDNQAEHSETPRPRGRLWCNSSEGLLLSCFRGILRG